VNNADIRFIVFDLGNVLIKVKFQDSIAYWRDCGCTITSKQLEDFLRSDIHHQFETARITSTEFLMAMRHSLKLPINDHELINGWNKALGEIFTGVQSLVANCAKARLLYCFSNTNVIHHEYWRDKYKDLLTYFQEIFTSHTMGLRKPDAAAFQHVLKSIGARAEHVLFFDDNSDNIHAARALGIHAVKVNTYLNLKKTLSVL